MSPESDSQAFFAAANARPGADRFLPAGWDRSAFESLFAYARRTEIKAGKPVIKRGETDRGLYFMVQGLAEIYSSDGDGMTLGPLSVVTPGSVVGEASFFDAQPRSASVWAIKDCALMYLGLDPFRKFEASQPLLARDVLFALGGTLAARLRSTNARIGNR